MQGATTHAGAAGARHRHIRLAGLMTLVLALGAHPATFAQKLPPGGRAPPARTGGPHAPSGPHQHLDGRFGHNQYYYDRGYSVRRPPTGGLGEIRARDGVRYWRHGGNWYRWNGTRWIVWGAPFGLFVPYLPWWYTTVWWQGVPYYYANETYYLWDDAERQYEVVAPPSGIDAGGTTVPPASDDLFVYPSQGQSAEQQAHDRTDCALWATGQTGFDPTVAGGGVPAEQASARRNDYYRAQVSCLVGRGYTVR